MKSLFQRVTESKQRAQARVDFMDRYGKVRAEIQMARDIAASKDGGLLVHVKAEAGA